MDLYNINVQETYEKSVSIEASSYEEAVEKVREDYNNKMITDLTRVNTEYNIIVDDLEINEEEYIELLIEKAEKLKDSFVEFDKLLLTAYSDKIGKMYDANDYIVNNYPFDMDYSEMTNEVIDWFDSISSNKNKIKQDDDLEI